MKKLLISLLTLIMCLTFAFGLAACGEEPQPTVSDEEIAKQAIESVKRLHSKLSAEDRAGYEVYGQTKIGDNFYDIAWSVTSTDVPNITEYVTFGTMDANKKIAVGIKRGTEDINYVLTATVTVNATSESTSFNKKIIAGEDRGDTETTTASLSFVKNNRTQQDGTIQVWEQNGIKVTNTVGSTAIADYADPARFYKGSKVIIEFPENPGIIHLDIHADIYNTSDYTTPWKNSITAAYPDAKAEIDENDETLVSVEFANPVATVEFTMSAQARMYSIDVEAIVGGLTDEQKVAAAKGALALAQVNYFEADTIALPAESNGANVTWSLKETSQYATVSNGNLTINSLPAADTDLVLVATITSGSVTDTKEVSIKLRPAPAVTGAGTAESPYTASDALKVTNLVDADGYYSKSGAPKLVYVTGYVVDKGTWDNSFSNWNSVYIADSAASSKDSADAIQIYRMVPDSTYLKASGDLLVGAKITVCGYLQNYKGNTPEVTFYGSTSVTATAYTAPSNDVLLDTALGSVDATLTVSKTGETTLPASSVSAVTFTWAVKSGSTLPAGTTLESGKLNVTQLPEADATFTLTVTAACGSDTKTKDVTVTVKAEGSAVEGFTPITEPAAGSDYYLAMDISGTWYYSTGAMESHFLGTTTEISKAAKVTVASSGSGWTLFTNGKFIEIEQANGYNNIMLNDSQAAGKVWMWDAEHAVFTMTVGSDTFFMGTYGTYTTFNAAYVSYLDQDNEYIGKIGTYTGEVTPPTPSDADATISFDDLANRTEISTQIQVWKQNGITFTNEKADSTTDINEKYYAPLRLYKSSSVKIEYTSAMTKIVFHCNSADYAGTLQTSLANTGATVTVDGTDVTVILATPSTTFEFSASAGQIRLDSVDVYTGEVEPGPGPGGEDEKDTFNPITAPVAGSDYYMGMKTQDGQYHYLTGAMDGYYMATTTSITSAKKVTLAGNDTDGWTITLDGKYIEIEVSNGHINAVYKTSQTAGHVWKWDSQYNIFTMEIDGTKYFLGTYGTFITVGGGDYASHVADNYKAVLGTYGKGSSTEPSEKTDAEKLAEAKAALKLSKTELTAVDEEVDLPATQGEATITWSISGTSDLVQINGNKLKVIKLPDADTEVTLIAAITVGGASENVDVKITVKAGSTQPGPGGDDVTLPDGDAKFDFSSVTEKGSEIGAGDATDYFKGFTESADLTAAVVSAKVYKGNGTGGGDYANTGGMLKLGTSSVGATITLTFAKNVTKVVILAQGWPNKSDTLAVNSGTAQTMSGSEKALYTFELTAPAKEIAITSNLRAFIFGITVTFESGTTTPKTDAEKVDEALAAVKDKMTVSEAKDVTLPTSTVEGVTFTWSTEDETYTVEGGGTLKVPALPKTDTTINLTLTATCNQETKTKEVTVTIKAAVTATFNPITAPVAGSDYYMGMKTQDDQYHYLTGAMSGYYMATTTSITSAKKVTLAGNDADGWTITLDGKYIEIEISGTHINAVYKASQTAGHVWMWDSQYNIFTMEISGTKYFLGTYGTFTTVGGGNYASHVASNWKAVLGTYGNGSSTEPVEPEDKTPQSITILDATGKDITGTTVKIPAEVFYGITVYPIVLPAGAPQAWEVSHDDNTNTSLASISLRNQTTTRVDLCAASKAKDNIGKKVVVTFTAKDTDISATVTVEFVENTPENHLKVHGDSKDDPLTVDELIDIIDKIGAGRDILVGSQNRYYYVTGTITKVETSSTSTAYNKYYLANTKGVEFFITFSNFDDEVKNAHEGLARADFTEGCEIVVGNLVWYKFVDGDNAGKYGPSSTTGKIFGYQAPATEPSVTFSQDQQGTFACSGGMNAEEEPIDPSTVSDLVVSEHSITWGDKVITNLQAMEGDPNSFTLQIDGENYGLTFMGGWMLAKLDEEGEMLEGYMFGDMSGLYNL